MAKQKIGFIFLDDIHHIPHFLTVFVELYTQHLYEVSIITFQGEHNYLKRVLHQFQIPLEVLIMLPTFRYRKILNKIRKRKKPSHVFIFKKNQEEFLNFDLLVYNVPQHNYLLNKRKKDTPKFVYLDHGAGDRDYIYNDTLTNFDLVTVAGKKVENLCKSNADFSKTNLQVCGYQKFDFVAKEKNNHQFFKNKNPVILYNPHFVKEISSFYTLGNDVLDFFYQHKEYNLIFAPHINLFHKRKHLNPSNFDKKYTNSSNIIVDFGSENSVNMNYVLSADVYLGDVSSQVYEFMTIPRPCIFLNGNNIDWKENQYYKNWKLGKVITDLSNFKELLDTSSLWQPQFINEQLQIVKKTFDIQQGTTPSKRIATEIKKLLQ